MKRVISLRGVSALLGAAVLLMLFASLAFAHSEPKECTPAIDGTVQVIPDSLVCTATQALATDQSKLEVFDAAGVQVDKGDSQVDLNDPNRTKISVSLDTAKIKDGVYTVKWETFSVDDNENANGEFTFTVATGAAQATAEPTMEVSATSAPPPTEVATVEATSPAPEATPTPIPAQTLPATGGASNNALFALIAVIGMLALGMGVRVWSRNR